MGLSGQCYALAARAGKRLGGPQGWSGRVLANIKSLGPPGDQTPDHPAHNKSLQQLCYLSTFIYMWYYKFTWEEHSFNYQQKETRRLLLVADIKVWKCMVNIINPPFYLIILKFVWFEEKMCCTSCVLICTFPRTFNKLHLRCMQKCINVFTWSVIFTYFNKK
jgi:hypothetical protein